MLTSAAGDTAGVRALCSDSVEDHPADNGPAQHRHPRPSGRGVVVRKMLRCIGRFMPRFRPRPLSRDPEDGTMPHLATPAAFVSLALAPLVVGLAVCSTAAAQTVTVDKETVAAAVSDQLANRWGVP
jgi:hypothetical protein